MTIQDQQIAKIKEKYYGQLLKYEELEDKLLGLLEQKVEIDQSKKSFTVISHFEKPKPDNIVVPTKITKVIRNTELPE